MQTMFWDVRYATYSFFGASSRGRVQSKHELLNRESIMLGLRVSIISHNIVTAAPHCRVTCCSRALLQMLDVHDLQSNRIALGCRPVIQNFAGTGADLGAGQAPFF
jgi:hypothetical protein